MKTLEIAKCAFIDMVKSETIDPSEVEEYRQLMGIAKPEYNELYALGYHCVKYSCDKGYYSRKEKPLVCEYKGRYGEGYKVYKNNPRSKWYGIAVEYWIKK